MASTWWDNIQIKEIPGVKKVTEDQKNATIGRAVKTWEDMKPMNDPEKIAFGIAMMGLESAFNPHIKGGSKTEYGLGQFEKDTWKRAVEHYNRNWQPVVDPIGGRDDHDAQIRVIGAWIPHIWDKAGEVAGDPKLKGYDQKQIAYGKWNQGDNESAEGVRDYLEKYWNKPDIGGYLGVNYDRAKQALGLRKQQSGGQ